MAYLISSILLLLAGFCIGKVVELEDTDHNAAALFFGGGMLALVITFALNAGMWIAWALDKI